MEKWTINKIEQGFKKFYEIHKRYPTASEIDEYHALPSSRQIQRKFGGLPKIREHLKLKGPSDFTRGEYSSERAKNIGKRAHEVEQTVYTYLVTQFGKPFVHREYFFTDDHRNRTDFYVYCKNDDNFLVDVFYPKDAHNFKGCLNNKMRTYDQSATMIADPIIFLMMNEDIGEDKIKSILVNKKNRLQTNQHVMTFSQLKEFCRGRTPLR